MTIVCDVSWCEIRVNGGAIGKCDDGRITMRDLSDARSNAPQSECRRARNSSGIHDVWLRDPEIKMSADPRHSLSLDQDRKSVV